MSVQAITWALDQTVGSPTGKIVLLCLANYADKDGSCFPGQTTIARECEISRRSVVEWMANLESMGLIARTRRFRANGSRTSDGVLLAMNGAFDTTSGEPSADSAHSPDQVQMAHEPSADERIDHVQEVHTHNRKNNRKKNPPPTPQGGLAGGDFNVIWDSWPEGDLPDSEQAVMRIFNKMPAADREAATEEVHKFLKLMDERKVRPFMVIYLRDRLFTQLVGVEVKKGNLVITPDMPEWAAWRKHLRKSVGEKIASQMDEWPELLAGSRMPADNSPFDRVYEEEEA